MIVTDVKNDARALKFNCNQGSRGSVAKMRYLSKMENSADYVDWVDFKNPPSLKTITYYQMQFAFCIKDQLRLFTLICSCVTFTVNNRKDWMSIKMLLTSGCLFACGTVVFKEITYIFVVILLQRMACGTLFVRQRSYQIFLLFANLRSICSI